jgi:hypothetical protein
LVANLVEILCRLLQQCRRKECAPNSTLSSWRAPLP